MTRDVAPDGSPVEIYLRLSPGDVPAMLDAAIGPGATVLDLGCGVGRLARPLAALGHAVTAVDESEAMVAHAHGIEAIHARIEDLDLGRRFGAVEIELHDLEHRDGGILHAGVTYRVDDRAYTQRFTAADVDDAALERAAAATGLHVVTTLDAERTWVALAPVRGS